MTVEGPLIDRADLVALIAGTAREYLLTVPGAPADTIDEKTHLFGSRGLLDSIGLVSVVLDLEHQLNDRYGTLLTLADERAVSQQRSPFRTVGSLADYVLELLGDHRDSRT